MISLDYFERVAVGLRLDLNIPQCIEVFCDDIKILTNSLSDFLVV